MGSLDLVRVSPLDLWDEPVLRLPGMRPLCRSDYLLVTPTERDRLVSEGYAQDYEPISPPSVSITSDSTPTQSEEDKDPELLIAPGVAPIPVPPLDSDPGTSSESESDSDRQPRPRRRKASDS
jgi:hypothetical protein